MSGTRSPASPARIDTDTASPSSDTIASFIRRVHEHATEAMRAAGLDSGAGVLVLSSYGRTPAGHPLPGRIRSFAIGDHQAMTAYALELAAEPHRNVFYGLQVMRRGLRRGQRGGLDDIIAVIGLVADIDADKGNSIRLEDLPVPPTCAVVTSHVPHRNLQPVWLFTRALSVAQATPLAQDLGRLVGDCDSATADVAHVWRLPGSLNWPTPAKLRRGRPPAPQQATREPGFATGEAVDPDHLHEAVQAQLDRHLVASAPVSEGRDLAESGLPAASRWDATADQNIDCAGVRPDAGSGDHDPGDPREWDRLMDALRHVPASDGRVWRTVYRACADWSHGSARMQGALDAWARGGTFEQWTFKGSACHRNDVHDQVAMWRSACRDRRGARIGYVFRTAGRHGWDTARARWGLSPFSPREQPLSEDAQRVAEAGAALPKERINLVRFAWLWQVARHAVSLDDFPIALLIAETTNTTSGFGFTSYERMSQILGWKALGGNSAGEYRRASRACHRMSERGLIALSKGNARGAHRRRGPSYAMTPPPGMDWQAVMDAFRQAFCASSVDAREGGRRREA